MITIFIKNQSPYTLSVFQNLIFYETWNQKNHSKNSKGRACNLVNRWFTGLQTGNLMSDNKFEAVKFLKKKKKMYICICQVIISWLFIFVWSSLLVFEKKHVTCPFGVKVGAQLSFILSSFHVSSFQSFIDYSSFFFPGKILSRKTRKNLLL